MAARSPWRTVVGFGVGLAADMVYEGADSAVKLDRRSHPTLGPDSPENDGPTPIVEEVGDHLRPKVLAEHPKATLEITTRAILIKFNAPLITGEDPTVDLIVGLRRLAWFEVTPAHCSTVTS